VRFYRAGGKGRLLFIHHPFLKLTGLLVRAPPETARCGSYGEWNYL
jgi:hypothetical protein